MLLLGLAIEFGEIRISFEIKDRREIVSENGGGQASGHRAAAAAAVTMREQKISRRLLTSKNKRAILCV